LAGMTPLGQTGMMSTYSFYFSHQISTIEGGMIVTDDEELYSLLKMFRSHGMSRDTDKETQKSLREKWEVDDFMDLFTFYVPGFNVRPTDLQAFIGLEQLKRLSYVASCRFENFKIYMEIFKGRGMWVPKVAWFHKISALAYPVITTFDNGSAIPNERDHIVKRLRARDIETRPIIAGSIGNQPFYKKECGEKFLPNANTVEKHGLYVPCNPDLTITQIRKICRIITSYD
jgi:CDP-4-dehydro-6-deoxyglucose reductase, E1